MRQAVTDGALYDITDMREWREEKGSGVVTLPRAWLAEHA